MGCEANTPSFSYVSVENLMITYNGVPYAIKNMYTNKMYIVWNVERPNQLEDTNVRPEDSLLKYLIIRNDKGIPTILNNDNITISFDSKTNGSNGTGSGEFVAFKKQVNDNTKKYNILSQTVDGMEQLIGESTELEDGTIIYNLNKVKADSKQFGVQISEIQTKVGIKYADLRPILLNNLVEYLRSVSEYKLSFTNIKEDTEITSDELTLINTNKTNMNNALSALQTSLDDLKAILDEIEDAVKSQIITDAKTQLNTLNTALINICTTALTNNKIDGNEKSIIIQKSYELSTYIGVVQNTCNNITVGGIGGVVYKIQNDFVVYKDKTESNIYELNRKDGELSEKYSNLTQTVDAFKLEVKRNKIIGSFRYIRDYLKGSTVNNGNHLVELQVFNRDGVNVALNKPVTCNPNGTGTNLTYATDGNVSASQYASVSGGLTTEDEFKGYSYFQVDLGSIVSNVQKIKIWHHYSDNRSYNHKLEVSQDGIEWFRFFDSTSDGRYEETSLGKTYIIDDSYAESQFIQSADKMSWIIKGGTSSSTMELTDSFYNVVSGNITLSADKINLNGYVSNDGGNFSIDQEGNMDVQDLRVKGEFSCESLTLDNLNNPKYPECLDGSLNINIDAVNGDNDSKLEEGTIFASLRGALSKIPKNLGGKTVNISLKSNLTENATIDWYYCGRINIFFEGRTLYGYCRTNRVHAMFGIYGGTISDSRGAVGSIMPNIGYNHAGVSASVSNTGSIDTFMYSMKIYSATNLANGCTESVGYACGDHGYVYIGGVTPIGCDVGFRSNSNALIYSDNSGGNATVRGFVAASGGQARLSNGVHTGGTVDNTYESSGGTVKKHSATFSTTAEDGTNTSTPPPTTKTETFTSNYGDTYRTTYSSWRNEGTVIQGNAYGSGNCRGYWFFGSQFAELKGATINKVVLRVKRLKMGAWSTPLSFKLAYHNYSSKPTTPSGSTPTYFQSVSIPAYSSSSDNYTNITITNQAVLDGIKNGTIKGFGLYDSNYASSSYGGASGTAKVTITYTE